MKNIHSHSDHWDRWAAWVDETEASDCLRLSGAARFLLRPVLSSEQGSAVTGSGELPPGQRNNPTACYLYSETQRHINNDINSNLNVKIKRTIICPLLCTGVKLCKIQYFRT